MPCLSGDGQAHCQDGTLFMFRIKIVRELKMAIALPMMIRSKRNGKVVSGMVLSIVHRPASKLQAARWTYPNGDARLSNPTSVVVWCSVV